MVDVIVLEHALNDWHDDEGKTAAHFEAELRKVLSWNTALGAGPPAVIVIELRVLLAAHLLAALYYDVSVQGRRLESMISVDANHPCLSPVPPPPRAVRTERAVGGHRCRTYAPPNVG